MDFVLSANALCFHPSSLVCADSFRSDGERPDAVSCLLVEEDYLVDTRYCNAVLQAGFAPSDARQSAPFNGSTFRVREAVALDRRAGGQIFGVMIKSRLHKVE